MSTSPGETGEPAARRVVAVSVDDPESYLEALGRLAPTRRRPPRATEWLVVPLVGSVLVPRSSPPNTASTRGVRGTR